MTETILPLAQFDELNFSVETMYINFQIFSSIFMQTGFLTNTAGKLDLMK
jgi:hypothetical protein